MRDWWIGQPVGCVWTRPPHLSCGGVPGGTAPQRGSRYTIDGIAVGPAGDVYLAVQEIPATCPNCGRPRHYTERAFRPLEAPKLREEREASTDLPPELRRFSTPTRVPEEVS